jgi:hypothetical protein
MIGSDCVCKNSNKKSEQNNGEAHHCCTDAEERYKFIFGRHYDEIANINLRQLMTMFI